MKNIQKIILFFTSIVLLHFFANTFGLYEMSFVWFDNILHILTGIGFGLVWLWVFRGSLKGAIIFVVALAILWELLEFGFLQLFPIYAYKLSIFSPNIGEALEDIFSNIFGVAIMAIYLKLKE